MIVKIIRGIKFQGNRYLADSVVDFDEDIANELIELGEAELQEEVKVQKPKAPRTRKATKEETKEVTGDEDNGGDESPLAKLPYRSLQIKASELGMPKVVGVSSSELAEFIASKLSEEDMEAFLTEASK